MTHETAFEIARESWRRLWEPDGRQAWSEGPLTFLPFDRLAVLHQRAGIEAHWMARRREYRFVEDRWNPIAAWAIGTGSLLAADVRVALEHRGETEWRTLTLTAVLPGETSPSARGLFSHLGEATPAALLGLLAAYEREARR